jgi:predicted N-acetyltransferase YhbS
MEYKPITPEDYEPVRQFLIEVGWQHRVGNSEDFSRMMKNTDRTVVAWDGQKVVGFARALCDDVSNGYVSLVAVAAERRGEGIGRKLVELLIGDDTNITWVLRAGRAAEVFGKRWDSSLPKWPGSE